jgi:hypothetical protein
MGTMDDKIERLATEAFQEFESASVRERLEIPDWPEALKALRDLVNDAMAAAKQEIARDE